MGNSSTFKERKHQTAIDYFASQGFTVKGTRAKVRALWRSAQDDGDRTRCVDLIPDGFRQIDTDHTQFLEVTNTNGVDKKVEKYALLFREIDTDRDPNFSVLEYNCVTGATTIHNGSSLYYASLCEHSDRLPGLDRLEFIGGGGGEIPTTEGQATAPPPFFRGRRIETDEILTSGGN